MAQPSRFASWLAFLFFLDNGIFFFYTAPAQNHHGGPVGAGTLAALAGATTASPRRARRAGSGRHLVGCWLKAAHGKERHQVQVGIVERLAGAGLVARARGGRRTLAVSSVAGSPPLEDARARRRIASPAALMAA